MTITITIPDAFIGNSPMVCIDSDTFTYSSPIEQIHGIQVERGVNKEDMLPHLDRIAEEVRNMLKKRINMTIQEFIQQHLPDYDKRSTDIALRVEKILNSNMTSRQKIEHYSGYGASRFRKPLNGIKRKIFCHAKTSLFYAK